MATTCSFPRRSKHLVRGYCPRRCSWPFLQGYTWGGVNAGNDIGPVNCEEGMIVVFAYDTTHTTRRYHEATVMRVRKSPFQQSVRHKSLFVHLFHAATSRSIPKSAAQISHARKSHAPSLLLLPSSLIYIPQPHTFPSHFSPSIIPTTPPPSISHINSHLNNVQRTHNPLRLLRPQGSPQNGRNALPAEIRPGGMRPDAHDGAGGPGRSVLEL